MEEPPRNKRTAAHVADTHHPPRLGIAQHEPGEDKQDETEGQRGMLQALVDRQTQIQAMRHRFLGDLALLHGELAEELMDEVEQVVQRHPANDQEDQDNVEIRDPIENRTLDALVGTDVHPTGGKALVDAGVALAAGDGQVVLKGGRSRIEVGFDRMRTVATRAIDHRRRAAARGQAVIAVGKRLEGIGGESVFFGEADGGVTGGAHVLGDVA